MEELPGEASCPICGEYFREPVSIHCGHHFCRGCIERCWEWPTAGFACPRCRDTAPQRSLRPSRELERVLELARRLSRGEALGTEDEEDEEGEMCQRHREPLELFCKEDGALLCAICRESRAHRAHAVLPLPEAARDFEEQIQAELQTLEDERDKLLELREAEMRRIWECLEQTAAERRRIQSRFRGLRLALEELPRRLLARLRRLESDIGGAQEERAALLTREISRLELRARELRERPRSPARTFLQDISSALSSLRNENFELPPEFPDFESKIQHFREENALLEETLRSFRDVLAFELPEKMPVTLEPSTAHPQLLVAPDGGSVTWESARDPPALGAQAGADPCVLGREAVTGGRRCWDVQVAPEGSWALGVAREIPGRGAGTFGSGAETAGREEGTPGNGEGTPWNGAGTPWNGAGTLGSGEGTPGNGTGTPGSGAGTLGSGAGTFGSGGETPGNGGETPGREEGTLVSEAGTPWNGAGILGNGEGTPMSGEGTLGSGGETLGNGEGTLGSGTGTLGNGAGTPWNGAGTPWNGAGTLGNGEGTPRNGAGTLGNEAGTLMSEAGIPGSKEGTPGSEAEPPGSGAGTLGNESGTSGREEGTLENGTEPPGSGAEPPEWELWSMGQCQGQFWALTSLERTPLLLPRAPRRVRVALDYDGGRVAFFDADERSLIFAFPAASFEGHSVRPWFLVWGEGARISLCP
ncbi:E3 ubiquitin-protein ligase TRIM7-like [Agelaius tricolor]|uniref:E3 ubiquitin-protein ligase TRIM7-like n=1 Tax=Agelaius tricolor TaxID=9191 RepID=UPI0039F1B6A3